MFTKLFRPNIERMKNRGNLKGLVKTLDHKDLNVRRSAVVALGQLGDSRIIDPILPLLKSRDVETRRVTISSLVQTGKQGVNDHLVDYLQDSDLTVRETVLGALEQLGISASAEKRLVSMLYDPDHKVRSAAAGALTACKWTPAREGDTVALLIAQRKFEGCVEIGDGAVDLLGERLTDNDPTVYEACAQTLGKIGSDAAFDVLEYALRTGHHGLQEEAGATIKRYGNKENVAKSIQTLDSMLGSNANATRQLNVYHIRRSLTDAPVPAPIRRMLIETVVTEIRHLSSRTKTEFDTVTEVVGYETEYYDEPIYSEGGPTWTKSRQVPITSTSTTKKTVPAPDTMGIRNLVQQIPAGILDDVRELLPENLQSYIR